jgi:hypothetical protein
MPFPYGMIHLAAAGEKSDGGRRMNFFILVSSCIDFAYSKLRFSFTLATSSLWFFFTENRLQMLFIGKQIGQCIRI